MRITSILRSVALAGAALAFIVGCTPAGTSQPSVVSPSPAVSTAPSVSPSAGDSAAPSESPSAAPSDSAAPSPSAS